MATETLPAVRADEPALTPFQVIEKVITAGDLAGMKPEDRVAFYWRTCQSLGLNPLTRPFQFISLNGKLVMYATKDCTEQLRKLNSVTVTGVRREKDTELGIYTVYAHGRDRDGREDESSGIVTMKGLSGEALANALMKAETKAKRRLTLSLVGLGFLDESEIEGAGGIEVDPDTGEIRQAEQPPSLLEAVQRQRDRLAGAPATATEAPPAEQSGVEFLEGEFMTAGTVEAQAPAEPATISANDFRLFVERAGIPTSVISDEGHRLFPGRTYASLNDQERAILAAAIAPKEE